MEDERHDTHVISICSSEDHSYNFNENDQSKYSDEPIEINDNENSLNNNGKNFYKELFKDILKKDENLSKKHIRSNKDGINGIKFPINYSNINKNFHFIKNTKTLNNNNDIHENNNKKNQLIFDFLEKNEKKDTLKKINNMSPNNSTINKYNKKNNNSETKSQLQINEISLKIEADHIIPLVLKPVNNLCYITKYYTIPKFNLNTCFIDNRTDLYNKMITIEEKFRTIQSTNNDSKIKSKINKSKSCDKITSVSKLENKNMINCTNKLKHKRALSCLACQKRNKQKESTNNNIYNNINNNINQKKFNISSINKIKMGLKNIKTNRIQNRCNSALPKNNTFRNNIYKDTTTKNDTEKTSNFKNNSYKSMIISNNEFTNNDSYQKNEYKRKNLSFNKNKLKNIELYLNHKFLNKTINQNSQENSIPFYKNTLSRKFPKKSKWKNDFCCFYENLNDFKLATLKKNDSCKNLNKNLMGNKNLYKPKENLNCKFNKITHRSPEILGKHSGNEKDCPVCKAKMMRMKLNNKIFLDNNNDKNAENITNKKNKFMFLNRIKTPKTILNEKERKLIHEIQTFLKYTKSK